MLLLVKLETEKLNQKKSGAKLSDEFVHWDHKHKDYEYKARKN